MRIIAADPITNAVARQAAFFFCADRNETYWPEDFFGISPLQTREGRYRAFVQRRHIRN